MRKMIALFVACLMIGSFTGCSMKTETVDEKPNDSIALLHTSTLTFESKKDDIDNQEKLERASYVKESDNEWYESNITLVLNNSNGNKFHILYSFTENNSIEAMMYLCFTEDEENTELVKNRAIDYVEGKYGYTIETPKDIFSVEVSADMNESIVAIVISNSNVASISFGAEDKEDIPFENVDDKDYTEDESIDTEKTISKPNTLTKEEIKRRAECELNGYDVLSLDILTLNAGGYSVSIQIIADLEGESALNLCKEIGGKIHEFNENYDVSVVSTKSQIVASYYSDGTETIY